MQNKVDICPLNRRAFIGRGTLILAGAATASLDFHNCFADTIKNTNTENVLRIALVTDVHYADKKTVGSRFYKESIAKIQTAAKEFKKQPIDFIVELGDLIDTARNMETDKKHLRLIDAELKKISANRYYVLGNHCVETLTKEEFLDVIGQQKSYFSFDQRGYHFVVLDANFRQDGVAYGRNNADWKDTKIPDAEIKWIKSDLSSTKLPTIIFLHQRLDIGNQEACAVKNSDKIRQIFEESGKVQLVLQGHHHSGGYSEINGIFYVTLLALIEGTGEKNNSFSTLEICPNGNFRLTGFLRQKSREIKTVAHQPHIVLKLF
ncbi:MAG: metallophosphoesterase [Planctomycetaceae bacterium]|jgi:alkaline phosphatase|nr:metallophosphoesterase [Planctomycetaceae bacterium]